MSAWRLPILMYHEVLPEPPAAYRKYVLTPAELARQLAWLARRGCTTVTMDAVAAAAGGGPPLPPRAVAITFDDAMAGCATHAPPLLARHGFTATFFVVAGLVGNTSRWLRAERGLELPMAGWAALRALEAAGHRCEAHSVTHPRLATLDAAACRAELADGRARLEDALGRPVRHLAYPFGSWDARVRALAADVGYATACTVREAHARTGDDLLALPRVPVVGGASMADFVSRLHTAHPLAGLVRAAVSGVRARLGGAAAHGRGAGT